MNNFVEKIHQPVCAKCFGDEDIVAFIRDWNGSPGCDFCGKNDAPTAPLKQLANHMRESLSEFYGLAHDQLPYDSREGGYQGAHWDTHDLLFDELGMDLPRYSNDLVNQLVSHIGDEVWCEYDWCSLDYDESLSHGWQQFCRVIQHERRFFFTLGEEPSTHPDDYSSLGLLSEICRLVEECGLIKIRPKGTTFFRARPCKSGQSFYSATDLGPPPAKDAVQANRMNPPGVPMLYAAETENLAALEIRDTSLSMGKFRAERHFRILDLADLPEIPGLFSGATRKYRLGLIFLNSFACEIAKPIDRTDRIHIDYIPSQVVTEFLRVYQFMDGALDGIRYMSSIKPKDRNLVLFVTQDDLFECDGTPVSQKKYPKPTPWIRLISAHNVDGVMVKRTRGGAAQKKSKVIRGNKKRGQVLKTGVRS